MSRRSNEKNSTPSVAIRLKPEQTELIDRIREKLEEQFEINFARSQVVSQAMKLGLSIMAAKNNVYRQNKQATKEPKEATG